MCSAGNLSRELRLGSLVPRVGFCENCRSFESALFRWITVAAGTYVSCRHMDAGPVLFSRKNRR